MRRPHAGECTETLRAPTSTAFPAHSDLHFPALAPPVGFSPPEKASPLTPTSLPDMSPTQTPPARCENHDDFPVSALRRSTKLERFGCPMLKFRGSFLLWLTFLTTCRFGSMPASHPASRQRSWHGLRC